MSIDRVTAATDTAAKYLSYRARTEEEVRKHLLGREFTDEEASAAIESLKEYHYLDDFKYCQDYFRYSAAKGKGRQRIEKELAVKGVKKDVITEALNDDLGGAGLEDERKRALEVGAKMLKQQLAGGKEADDRFQARVGRRLAGLGYSSSNIYFVLGKIQEHRNG